MIREFIKSSPEQSELDLGIKNKKLVNIPKKKETELTKLKFLAKEEKPETEKETEHRMLYPWHGKH